MADVTFEPPESVPPLRSGTRDRFWRLWYWLRAVVLWTDAPTAAAYEELRVKLDVSERRRLKLETLLASAQAELDAAKREVQISAAVWARNEERVKSEQAGYAADRERAVNSAGESRNTRNRE